MVKFFLSNTTIYLTLWGGDVDNRQGRREYSVWLDSYSK